MFRIGSWCVNPVSGQISRDGETARVEVRTMRLLLCLAERSGEVVSIDELLNQVWPDVTVASDSVYQAVASLRRLLGDDPKQPTYIATVPRLGYRMMAPITPWVENTNLPNAPDPSAGQQFGTLPVSSQSLEGEQNTPTTVYAPAIGRRRRTGFMKTRFSGKAFAWSASAALCLAMVASAFVFYGDHTNGNHSAVIAAKSQKSIAVLPFLDLTQGMNQEPFADGMTEELIDKFSKIPGIQVPPPTSSFYFKGKQIPVAEIAKTLGVVYVLDGSVRKSGPRLRVAARLIRADSGYIVWSETYDRPFDDILMVQDDIANEVTKALKASIETNPGGN